MAHYECTFVLKGDLEEKDVEEGTASIRGWIEKESGSLIKMDNWGKKRLAYRVEKQRYGYYLYTLFELDPTKTKPLEWNFKISENIIKYLMIRISEKEMAENTASAEAAAGGSAGQVTSTKPAVEA